VAAVGILGGSFDPVHFAHLIVAEQVREALGLGRVLLIPAARQPLKAHGPVAPGEDRLTMLRLAAASNPGLEVDPLELERGGTSYTAETLDAIRGRDPEAELYLILGSDAYRQLDRWRRIEDVRRGARLVVVPRAGPRAGARASGSEMPAAAAPGEPALRVEVPVLEISASDVRARAARGDSIRYFVPDAVREYILERGLYGSPGSRPGR
jgi:nicotinate-nucleotide adenylyltransferase